MIKLKTLTLGIISSCALIAGAHAQGLLGERYVEFGVGYQKVSLPGDSLDGASIGGAVNFPVSPVDAPVGFDVEVGTASTYLSNDDVELDGFVIGTRVRGYVPTGANINPYMGTGLNWSYSEVSAPGFRESDSTFSMPLEAGVEFVAGTFSITPFYRYKFATESGYDDSWSVGTDASLWFNQRWGITAGVTRTDLDDGWKVLTIGAAALVSF